MMVLLGLLPMHDDVLLAKYLHPPLTTVSQPVEEVGQLVVDLLFKQINDEPIDRKRVLLKPELVIRESS